MTFPAYYRRTRIPGPINGITLSSIFGSSDLALWLNADEVTGNDGDAIGTWYDKTDYANNATQGTEANKPVLKKNILNGHAVMRFDGAGDLMGFADGIYPSPMHLFFVIMAEANNSRGLIGGAVSGALRINLESDNKLNLISSSVAYIGESTTALTLGNYYLVEIAYNNPAWAMYTNGNATGSGSNARTMTKAITLADSHQDVTWDGDIAEVLAFKRSLTAEEMVQVRGYINGKYALW